jgi:hypothetical protein
MRGNSYVKNHLDGPKNYVQCLMKLNMKFFNEWGSAQVLPILMVVGAVGIISYLLISSTAPSGGFFGKLNPKPASHAGGGSTPFNGPHNIPGTVQAEDYDIGGEGVAYHDIDVGNNGGAYRSEDVDIKATNDTGGGNTVGWGSIGEWLNYTVNITNSGTYSVKARLCTLNTLADPTVQRTETLAVDGTNVGVFTSPMTGTSPNGDWCTFQDATLNNISLTAGTHVLRMTNSGPGDSIDFNSLTFTQTGSTTGFTGQYWNAGSGSAPTFPTTAANLTRNDSAINFDWGGGSPDPSINADHFMARWTGSFNFNAGSATFTTNVDDGVRVYVDNNLIIDHWIDEGATTYTSSQNMTAGAHTVVMEYYENTGGASATLSWTQAGGTPPPSPSPTPVAGNNVKLTMNPASVGIGTNQTTTININMDTGADNVSAAELHLTFDATKLQIQSLTAGAFLSAVLTPATFNNTAGTASIILGSGTTPAHGTGTIASFVIKALTSTGTTPVSFANTTQTATVGKASNSLSSATGSSVQIGSSNQVKLSISPVTASVAQNQNTTLNLNIDTSTDQVTAAELHLKFDPD